MQGKSVPKDLLKSLRQVEGFDEEAFVAVHEGGTQVTSIRINPAKMHAVDQVFPGSEKVPWSSTGFYLPSRPSFIFDPLLHAGAYYVQEASGMFIEKCLSQTLDLKSPLRVLDLCAAPGGKSTLIQSLISPESILVSNEVIKSRVNVLIENLVKWGGRNVVITNNDPRDFARLENFFDVMVIDAPCSGSGLFRRDPGAMDEWSTEAVQTCSQRQQRILSDAYPCLNRGGILIYSTCSYSPEEDEYICDWLLTNHDLTSVKLSVLPEWNIMETMSDARGAYGYRFFPDKLRGEGFFVACFKKGDGDRFEETKIKNTKLKSASRAEAELAKPWLKGDLDASLFNSNEDLLAFPTSLANDLSFVVSALYVRKAGVTVGRPLRDELLPAHDLSLSSLVSDKLFTVSLKKEVALQYLRKEEVTIQVDHKGWALVQYEGQTLGWVKMLGNRINNYYPKEWRILKSGNI